MASQSASATGVELIQRQPLTIENGRGAGEPRIRKGRAKFGGHARIGERSGYEP